MIEEMREWNGNGMPFVGSSVVISCLFVVMCGVLFDVLLLSHLLLLFVIPPISLCIRTLKKVSFLN